MQSNKIEAIENWIKLLYRIFRSFQISDFKFLYITRERAIFKNIDLICGLTSSRCPIKNYNE